MRQKPEISLAILVPIEGKLPSYGNDIFVMQYLP